MAIRSYQVPLPGQPGKLFESYLNQSENSSKVNGKLVLSAHNHTFAHTRVTRWTNVAPGRAYTCGGAETNYGYPFDQGEYNQVYTRFVGKLRAGSGSLGVTLASWGQSRAMIVNRLTSIRRIFDQVQRRRNRNPRRRRYSSRQLASDFLEGEFGWVPLLGDIHALCTTIAGDAIPRQWIRSSERFPYNRTVISPGQPKITQAFSGWGRVTISSGVDIANPNLWLLNRMGLINPAVVAWDLVPWSFVVNMFVNVNQVLGSFTDTVGLSLTNASTTYSSSVLVEQTAYSYFSPQEAYFNMSNVTTKNRNRQTGAPPRPSLRFRLPNVNFELMAIASALLRQRVGGMR